MIRYSEKNRENYRESAFDKKKPRLKFNPGSALAGVRTTGSRCINGYRGHSMGAKPAIE